MTAHNCVSATCDTLQAATVPGDGRQSHASGSPLVGKRGRDRGSRIGGWEEKRPESNAKYLPIWVSYILPNYRVFLKILTHFFRILLWCLLQHKHNWGLVLIRDHWKFISIVFHHYLSLSLQSRAEYWNVSPFWPNRFRLCAAFLLELCGTPELSPPSHTP